MEMVTDAFGRKDIDISIHRYSSESHCQVCALQMEEYTITNLKGDDSFTMNENKGQSQCWKVTRGSDSWVVKRTMDKTIACYEEIMVNRYSTFLNVLIEYGMPSSQSESNSKRSIIDEVAEHCKVCDNFVCFSLSFSFPSLYIAFWTIIIPSTCAATTHQCTSIVKESEFTPSSSILSFRPFQVCRNCTKRTMFTAYLRWHVCMMAQDLDRENIMYRLYPCTTAENKQRYRLHFVISVLFHFFFHEIVDFSSIRKVGSQEQTYSHSEERKIHLLSVLPLSYRFICRMTIRIQR